MKTKTLLYPLLFIFLTASQSCKKDSTTSVNSTAGSSDEQLAADIAVSDSSLLCYLPFKGNLKDKSGHGNNGVLNGTISYVPDRLGNPSGAASFAASNSWIEIPEAQFVGMEKGTIALEFYVTSTSRQVLVSKMSYAQQFGTPGWYQSFVLVADLSISTPLQYGCKTNGYCASSAGWNSTLNSYKGFALNQWNHLTITFNNTVEKMYLNGNIVGIVTRTSSPICSGEPIRLGVWWKDDPLYFTGKMDELRIYNRVLTINEIKRLL